MAFPNLAGGMKIWRVKEKGKYRYYAVYTIPGRKVPGRGIPLLWRIRNRSELKALTGTKSPRISRRITRKGLQRLGGVKVGFADEIRNKDKHPLSDFWQLYREQARVNPMLRNREVMAKFVSAVLEGREPTTAELHNTKWWRSRSAEERAFATLAADSPREAQMRLARNRYKVRDMLLNAGWQGGNVGGVAKYLSDQVTKGHRSEEWLDRQIDRWTDPYDPGAHKFAGRDLPEGGKLVYHPGSRQYYYRLRGKDYKIGPGAAKARFVSGRADEVRRLSNINDAGWITEILTDPFGGPTALGGEEEVRQLVREWLGPVYGGGWTYEDYGRWAHKIRDAEGARDQLIDELRRQRQAVLPDYDPNLTYDQIAQPWRGVVQNQWGTLMDEADPIFQRMLKNNDQGLNEALLRSEGLKRRIGKVERDAWESFMQAFGGQVTGVI